MAPEIAPGAFVSPRARLGDGVRVDPGAVIYDDVVLGDGCLVEANAVLGKQPRLRRGSSAASAGELEPLMIGAGSTVCCGAVVYVGARVGQEVILGDQCQIRERALVGSGSVVGRGSSVDFDARVGERVLIQTGVYVTGGSLVEDDVFLGPGVQMANDNTMGRHPRGESLRGPVVRRAARVGAGAVLLPGVEIGAEAFVAAGAVVVRDIGPREVVMGVPARVVRHVPDEDLLERWR
ncbi:MAG TPA: DapH/DapD/GlmU-related protein [Solirubrobacteraceae bacterium]|nr:DapH/DapD/GlmU-related protein [Solirubrobacteraceae bacterium]